MILDLWDRQGIPLKRITWPEAPPFYREYIKRPLGNAYEVDASAGVPEPEIRVYMRVAVEWETGIHRYQEMP